MPGRDLGALAGATVVLVVAFLVAPARLAAGPSGVGFTDEHHLGEAFRGAFVRFWTSGGGPSPRLDGIVDFWLRYHVVKAGIAAVTLIVLVTLGLRLWTAFAEGGAGTGGAVVTASAGVLVTALALLALVTVMANVQGAVAPFASLLPLLVTGAADGELAASIGHVRQQLADHPPAASSPALRAMVDDFARYHQAMVVIAASVGLALAVAAVTFWRRGGRAPRATRARRLLRSFALLSALLSLAVIVVGAANATTAAAPAPALLALFDGGW